MNEFKRKEKIKLLTVAIFCLIGIIGVVSYTYSFFQIEAENSTVIKGKAATANLTVNVNKISPTEETELGLIPQLDDYITTAVVGRQGSCIDDNGNEVCQVYEIKVKNTSTSTVRVDGVVELSKGNITNLKWAKISHAVTTQNQTKPTLLSNVNETSYTTLTTNETYTSGAEKNYYIVVWISETGIPQRDNGSFGGIVRFTDSEAITPASTTLYNVLNIVPKKDVLTTFTTTSAQDGTTGVYKAEDDIGTSYYFRGNVENNYVKFGKYTEDAYAIFDSITGTSSYSSTECDTSKWECLKIASAGDDMYWRIVRINGDGTVRMIYAGTDAYANSDNTALRNIGMSSFNKNYDDNAYVGYMYGTIPSTTYAEAHANEHDSSIKTTIDRWYTKYLNSNYSSFIADAIYCNDRKVVTDETVLSAMGASTDGFGTSDTAYGLFNRMNLSMDEITPTLKCERENDRFIEGDIVSGIVGNSELTNPIGLITADELVYGGSFLFEENDQTYLYDNNWFWTLSPGSFGGGIANAWYGDLGTIDGNSVDNGLGVRSAISLDSTAIIGGTGTATDPYTIS